MKKKKLLKLQKKKNKVGIQEIDEVVDNEEIINKTANSQVDISKSNINQITENKEISEEDLKKKHELDILKKMPKKKVILNYPILNNELIIKHFFSLRDWVIPKKNILQEFLLWLSKRLKNLRINFYQ